ncbi:MAG: DUF4398 domain-containing protein [Desulfobacterales bacterium]
MSGDIICPLLMEARPNLRVLVFSGYSIDGPAQKILNAGDEDFIQKPFTIVDLSEKLKKSLRRAQFVFLLIFPQKRGFLSINLVIKEDKIMKWSTKTAFSVKMVLIGMLSSVFFLACSANTVPIQKDISNAEMIITRAQTGDVDEYAPLELRLAKEKLQEAKSAFDREEYKSAQYLAREALLTANLAQEKARTEKTRKIVQELRESIDTLNKELLNVQ